MSCLVLWLIFFVVANSDAMEMNGEQDAQKIFNYYVSELAYQDQQQLSENFCSSACISGYDHYFADNYNQIATTIAQSNCLFAVPAQQHSVEINQTSNYLPQAQRVPYYHPHERKTVIQSKAQPQNNHNAFPSKPNNYKYHPSPRVAQNPKRLKRYDAFHELLSKRYDEAIKECCNESFETLADLRMHIKNIHASKSRTKAGVIIQFVLNQNKIPTAYASVDAAVSYLLLKKNKKIFSCDRCKRGYKTHTSFYSHYLKKCRQ